MSSLNEKVVVEVGLNEGTPRSSNPRVAYTPEEIAADARRCLDAGASVVHYHGRDPETGSMDNSIDLNIEIQRLVTESTPLIAYPTYGDSVPVCDGYSQICSPAEVRFRHFAAGVRNGVRFEVGPIDLGAFYDYNAVAVPGAADADIDGWVLNRGHQMNNGWDHLWLCRFCEEHGLQKSFAAPDTMCLLNLRNLVDMGLVPEPQVSLKLFFWRGRALATRYQAMLALTRELFTDKTVRWTPVVQGADGLPLAARAIADGGDVRTGIGDYHYADQGAPTNAELVERVVTMATAVGREPASPDEARTLKGIAPLGVPATRAP
ncbi:MAG TPA: 3-keto-5-aminohexanoate cleavage protein [Acidimicrobiia bacterium]|nr:3-keto-5-aminohexanoate cleavage protein [Acidimicrobiia bacterium]